MRRHDRLLVIGLLVTLSTAVTPVAAQKSFEWRFPVAPLEAQAYVNQSAIRPGDTFQIGVQLKIQSDWHVYANPKGPAPTGQPVNLSVSKHPSITFEPTHYPQGERYELQEAGLLNLSPNESWNWVHHDEAFLVISGMVSATAPPGTTQLELSLEGQICKQQCIPFIGTVTIPIEIVSAETTIQTRHPELFPDQSLLNPSPKELPTKVDFEWKRGVDYIQATAYLSRQPLNPGQDFQIAVTLTPKEGWHLFANPKGPGIGREVSLQSSDHSDLKIIRTVYPEGERYDPAEPELLGRTPETAWTNVYHTTETILLTAKLSETVTPQTLAMDLSLSGQVCEEQCIAFHGLVTIPLQIAESGTESQLHHVSRFSELSALTDLAEPPSSASETVSEPGTSSNQQSLWIYLASCFAVGLAAVLSPCFYPMIPVTVTFFMKEGEREGARPLFLATIYSLTIVVACTILGLVLGSVFAGLGSGPYMNLFFGALFIVFGMSLIGMFEIPVPQGLVRVSSKGETKGGTLGVMFMALTLLVVGTPCIGPLLGPVLLGRPGQPLETAAGTLVFSLALAVPFFLLALTPGMLGKLPKSGGWMNTVKVVMGLLLIGVSFKFLVSVDQFWQWDLFSRTSTLCIWASLALVTTLYLLGLIRFDHDAEQQGISGGRALVGVGFLAVAIYFGSGLFRPLADELDALWPLDQTPSFASPSGPSSPTELPWQELTLDQALATAQENNQRVFIDFTGKDCIECKYMETRMARRWPRVRQQLENLVLAKLYTDRRTDQDNANKELLLKRFESAGPPFYAILSSNGETLAEFSGGTRQEEEFLAFINKAVNP